jgi:hypothetical protein
MPDRIKINFLLLILAQGVHSIEEYFTRLWEVFYPARVISNLVSNETEIGFIIINVSLFVFGIFSWFIIAKKNNITSQILIWLFIFIEFINGIGHPIWALSEMDYVPGLFSALIILFLNIYLTRQILRLSVKN